MLIDMLTIFAMVFATVVLVTMTFVLVVLSRGYIVFKKAYKEAQAQQKAKKDAEAAALNYMKVNYPILYKQLYPKG